MNVIETVRVNGNALTPSSKAVNITVPTLVSALTNDKAYQTATEVTNAIASAVGKITSISYSKVSALPTTGENGVIYLVAHTHGTKDIYDEYIWLSDSKTFEKIGNTDIDLSAYAKTADFTAISTSDLNTMWG